jgi:acetylornithine deacetylase/succinyl-diaminopimelate desuccinylase-like protein
VTDERLGAEAVELTRALVRIDTSNPPGGETAAAEFLAGWLAEAGEGRLEVELCGPDPERLNLIARLRGGEGPSLMLLGHTDVVPAPADSGWTVPPFDGRVEHGHVIGRGAADMKSELAARAAALCAFARSGEPPAGDVVLVAEADEERNFAGVGITWLLQERPEIACAFGLNEGGGNLYELADGRKVVSVSIGEKLTGSARLRFHGRGGHASTPLETENPIAYATEAAQRLLSARAPRRAASAVEEALAQLGVAELGDDELIAWAREQHPLLAPELDAMLRLTVTPTGLATDTPTNVIPPYADVVCDCRAVPGSSFAEVEEHVARALGDGPPGVRDYELTRLEDFDGGTASPAEGPLYEAIEGYVAERLPGAVLLPIVSTGFSDSAYLRVAFPDTRVYGFAPVWATDQARYYAGIHSADESIAVADIEEQARFALAAIEGLRA